MNVFTWANMSEHSEVLTTVNIPRLEPERLKKILKNGGYANFAEFVRDATRRRLEEIEKEAS